MPKASVKKMQYAKNKSVDETDTLYGSSPEAPKLGKKRPLSIKEETPLSKHPKKIEYYENAVDTGAGGDFEENVGIKSLLNNIGSGINKSISAKKRHVQDFSENMVQASKSSIDDFLKDMTQTRKQVVDEFKTNMFSLLEKCQTDMNNIKEQEVKLSRMIHSQLKQHKQVIAIQEGRLNNFRQITTNFLKVTHAMENEQRDKFSAFQGDLMKNLTHMQKKFEKDLQQEQIDNVRKSMEKWF